MPSPSLANYAFLLEPVDDHVSVEIVEASEDWSVDLSRARDADVVLWGRVPLRSPPGPGALLRHVGRRRRALRALSAGKDGFTTTRVHRLAPPPGPAARVTAEARDYLLGGALVELAAGAAPPTRLDAVATAAGVVLDWASFSPGSDRAATTRGTLEGRDVIVRAGPSGTPSDPGAAATALEELEAAGIERVPRVVARGAIGAVAYACETVLSGRRPRRLDEDLVVQVAVFLSGLPRGEVATRGLEDDLSALQSILPDLSDDLDRIRDRSLPAFAGVPSVMTHGDLWAGNLFVQSGRLTGVIDWDGARRDGIPGTDLLHLVVSARRARAGGDIGDAWVARPWRGERFAQWSAPYWRNFDLDPTNELLDAVGCAWWAGWLRQALERHERRLDDQRWLAANVAAVLTSLREDS